VQEIVTALGSDPKKVVKWVSQHLAARGASVPEIAEKLRIEPREVRKLLRKKGG